jgi:hypothetical protein
MDCGYMYSGTKRTEVEAFVILEPSMKNTQKKEGGGTTESTEKNIKEQGIKKKR